MTLSSDMNVDKPSLIFFASYIKLLSEDVVYGVSNYNSAVKGQLCQ
jgi:hypothetical protein